MFKASRNNPKYSFVAFLLNESAGGRGPQVGDEHRGEATRRRKVKKSRRAEEKKEATDKRRKWKREGVIRRGDEEKGG